MGIFRIEKQTDNIAGTFRPFTVTVQSRSVCLCLSVSVSVSTSLWLSLSPPPLSLSLSLSRCGSLCVSAPSEMHQIINKHAAIKLFSHPRHAMQHCSCCSSCETAASSTLLHSADLGNFLSNHSAFACPWGANETAVLKWFFFLS